MRSLEASGSILIESSRYNRGPSGYNSARSPQVYLSGRWPKKGGLPEDSLEPDLRQWSGALLPLEATLEVRSRRARRARAI
jgi:hypothetical protein